MCFAVYDGQTLERERENIRIPKGHAMLRVGCSTNQPHLPLSPRNNEKKLESDDPGQSALLFNHHRFYWCRIWIRTRNHRGRGRGWMMWPRCGTGTCLYMCCTSHVRHVYRPRYIIYGLGSDYRLCRTPFSPLVFLRGSPCAVLLMRRCRIACARETSVANHAG